MCGSTTTGNSKTMAKMAVARVKLLRNKREVVIRQMRRDIAMLLDKKQDATARVRVIFPFFPSPIFPWKTF